MCEDNEQKMKDRNNTYKQFFNDFGYGLDKRQILHDQVVGEQARLKTKR